MCYIYVLSLKKNILTNILYIVQLVGTSYNMQSAFPVIIGDLSHSSFKELQQRTKELVSEKTCMI